MTFPLDGTVIATPQVGANSRLYRCPAADIGEANATALAHANCVVCANTSEHMVDPGIEWAEVSRDLMGGQMEQLAAPNQPKISFKLTELRNTAGNAAEVDAILTAALTGAPIWLASLSGLKTTPGAMGLMGLCLLKVTRKSETKQAFVWEIEGAQAVVQFVGHKIQWHQVPAT